VVLLEPPVGPLPPIFEFRPPEPGLVAIPLLPPLALVLPLAVVPPSEMLAPPELRAPPVVTEPPELDDETELPVPLHPTEPARIAKTSDQEIARRPERLTLYGENFFVATISVAVARGQKFRW